MKRRRPCFSASSLVPACLPTSLDPDAAAPESPGWKWLVIALVIYVVVDKSGLLSLGQPSPPVPERDSPPGEAAFAADDVSTVVYNFFNPYLSAYDEAVSARALGSAASDDDDDAAGNHTEGDNASLHEEDEHATHPHEAMLFLLISIVLSTLILHASMKFKGLQHTVLLFACGCTLSLFFQGLRATEWMGAIGRSWEMWVHIDPHLLVYTLLPPLLAGDAMSIDTSVVSRVAYQCMFLAGPGVLANAFITAGFLKLYLGWEWLLCLTTGSILCATDPVAVVALLKELSASPTLTVTIQGESLLNDGTAIVLFTVAYNMLKGQEYDAGDVVVFLVKTALYAWLFGICVGAFFYFWIRMAKNKLDHNSSLIQVSLTIACCYSSFLIAEGVFKISGVLATVASSLVLAHMMWPDVVCHETMHSIWHVFEYLGNTIIFFLAGALTGNVMVRIPPIDYLYLILIYITLVFIRCFLFFLSRPILKQLHPEKWEVPVPDTIVMVWGGLRGAVGLALAIQVSLDRAGDKIAMRDANRVFFFVGGVALLTLCVNATTCPAIVRHLGITQMPKVKLKIMMMIHSQLKKLFDSRETCPSDVQMAIGELLTELEMKLKDSQKTAQDDGMTTSENGGWDSEAGKDAARAEQVAKLSARVPESFPPPARPSGLRTSRFSARLSGGPLRPNGPTSPPPSPSARKSVLDTVNEARASLGDSAVARQGKRASEAVAEGAKRAKAGVARSSFVRNMKYKVNVDCAKVLERFKVAKERFESIPEETRAPFVRLLDPNPLEEQMGEILKALEEGIPDRKLSRGIRDSFLVLTRAEYWHQIDRSEVSTDVAEPLFMSLSLALSKPSANLSDFEYFCQPQTWPTDASTGDGMKVKWIHEEKENGTNEQQQVDPEKQTTLHKINSHPAFHTAVMVGIIISSILIFVEEDAGEKFADTFLVFEIIFLAFFTIEALLKIAHEKVKYFLSSWNMFDFLLVVLGIFGLVVRFMVEGENSFAQQAYISRSAKIFRILRAMRLVRLVRVARVVFMKITGRDLALEVAQHMKRFSMLYSFIQANFAAQNTLIGYCGKGADKIFSPEIARVIVQAQANAYNAMTICAYEKNLHLKDWMLEETYVCKMSIETTRDLEHFVAQARIDGLLSATEAETIIHAMHHHVGIWQKRSDAIRNGLTSEPVFIEANSTALLQRAGRQVQRRGEQDAMAMNGTMSSLARATGWCTRSPANTESESREKANWGKAVRSAGKLAQQAQVLQALGAQAATPASGSTKTELKDKAQPEQKVAEETKEDGNAPGADGAATQEAGSAVGSKTDQANAVGAAGRGKKEPAAAKRAVASGKKEARAAPKKLKSQSHAGDRTEATDKDASDKDKKKVAGRVPEAKRTARAKGAATGNPDAQLASRSPRSAGKPPGAKKK